MSAAQLLPTMMLTPTVQDLIDAAQEGDTTGVSMILDADPSLVNMRDDRRLYLVPAMGEPLYIGGLVALHVASAYGREGAVSLLLENGADPNKTNGSHRRSGVTALLLAAQNGQLGVVERLLRSGIIDVNYRAWDKRTALFCAAEHGHVDVVRTILLHGGVDHTLSNFMQWTPREAAKMGRHTEVIELLEVRTRHSIDLTCV